jgi:hypothetical protein
MTMGRAFRIAAAAATLMAALPLGMPVHAQTQTALQPGTFQTGMWWQLETNARVAPAPPTVPAGGLWVASLPTGAFAISAVRFQLRPDEHDPILTLTVALLTKAPSTGLPLGFGEAPVLACEATSDWQPTGSIPGTFAGAPKYDCSKGQVSPNAGGKGVLTFDLTSITTPGELVSLVFIPGLVTNPIPGLLGQLPISIPIPPLPPELPGGIFIPSVTAAEIPATFNESFAALKPDALSVVKLDISSEGATQQTTQPAVTPPTIPILGPAPLGPSPTTNASTNPTTNPATNPTADIPAVTPTTQPNIGQQQLSAPAIAPAVATKDDASKRVFGLIVVILLAVWVFEIMARDRGAGALTLGEAPPPGAARPARAGRAEPPSI